MINKQKLSQAKDLNEFSNLEEEMEMSWWEFQERLKLLRLCARDARLAGDEEERDFYEGLIRDLKNEMNDQLNWLDSAERFHMLENLAESDFVKSIFRMKAGDN